MNRPVTVLSLFDGMACGMLAMIRAGMKIKHYIAYETDKYAIKTAKYNFPEIYERGDVFRANFEQYSGKIDYLIGGSPCTYWSVAQKNNRETTPSGIGWKLFMQYVRALHEVQPQFFIYENNRSMSAEIQKAISDTFGFEPICINSALVSAQMRQRLYWVGVRSDNGTYGKVDVTQPEDRNILLPDVLDGVIDREKSRAVIASVSRTTTREYFHKQQGQMSFEPVVFSKPHGFNKGGCKYEKAPTLTANGDYQHNHMVVEPVNYTADGKAQTLKAQYINTNVRNICCYSSTYGATGVAEPVNMTANGKAKCLRSTYHKNGIRDMVANSVDRRTCVAEAVRVGTFPRADGELTEGQGFRVYSSDAKAVTLKGCSGGKGGKTGLYAIPIEFVGNEPVRAVSGADGKAYDVYRVENGMIYIGDKPYPIRLSDGLYIIRKLTVPECMRLQTVPYWYRFPVHDTQAYKMLGNGWTIEVIAHIIRATQKHKKLADKKTIIPINLRTANDYVTKYHRHHGSCTGCKFCLGLNNGFGELCGVAICGRPVSRYYDDGETLEINRLCTNGERNACSMLYGRCVKIAKGMGYKRVITYTLESETGASLRASNFIFDGIAGGEIWTGSRKRDNGVPQERKKRWIYEIK